MTLKDINLGSREMTTEIKGRMCVGSSFIELHAESREIYVRNTGWYVDGAGREAWLLQTSEAPASTSDSSSQLISANH